MHTELGRNNILPSYWLSMPASQPIQWQDYNPANNPAGKNKHRVPQV